jgi:hypothetical protein
MIDRSNIHGPFLFLLGQFGTEHFFDLQEQFNGIYAVKPVFFSQIIIQSRIFNLKLLSKKSEELCYDFITRHIYRQ